MPLIENEVTAEQLKRAINDNELVIYHQPKVCMLKGEVSGSEALVRWLRPDGELILPDAFIPLAERSGMLSDITALMLQHSIDSIKKIKQTYPGLSVSMNVTPSDLESHAVSNMIASYLENGEIASEDLQIEITESIAMGELSLVSNDLVNLNNMGITVLMDDFGTGYSSIDRLSQLPFSALKLDKGVVQRMASSKQNLDVVKSSISMARELRMSSVAEGVETEGAYNFLLANGCEEAQGYWISHPLTLDEYLDFLAPRPRYAGSQIGRVHQALFNLIHFRKSLLDAAYCSRMGEFTVLDSVIDPEVKLEASESRFGLWYYGIGQRIGSIAGYAELEEPFLALHKCGQQFMRQLEAGASTSAVVVLLTEFDQYMDNLTSALRVIERELLLAAR